jgi:hypothetical protein
MHQVMSMSRKAEATLWPRGLLFWQERQTCSQNDNMKFPAVKLLAGCRRRSGGRLWLTKAGSHISMKASSPTPLCCSSSNAGRSIPRKIQTSSGDLGVFAAPYFHRVSQLQLLTGRQKRLVRRSQARCSPACGKKNIDRRCPRSGKKKVSFEIVVGRRTTRFLPLSDFFFS